MSSHDPAAPRIAIVIRTKNEADWIGNTLAAIRDQTRAADAEVIVIDSGSTDETPAIARAWEVRLLAIPADTFTYGRALNLAIDRTTAPVVVSLSAHATPVERTWLADLVAPLADPRVGAVYGRHIPRGNATPWEIFGMWLSGTLSRRRRIQRRSIGFSNTNSAFRRAIWERRPFDERLPGAEDFDWARAIQQLGHAIVYEPKAAVYHSHGESIPALLRRMRQDQPVIVRAWLNRHAGAHRPARRPVPLQQLHPRPIEETVATRR